MKFFASAAAVACAGLVLASPTPTNTLVERADFCGQWDSTVTGGYTVYNNLWGQSSGSGSQCTGVDSASGGSISWHTSWSWSGGSYNVKSYSNAALQFTSRQLSAVSSISSSWSWSYSGSNLVANVAYDIFTGSTTSTSSPEYEIMIWLGALGGAGPISSTGSAIATPTIAGRTWNLFYGLNGSVKVYSFVAQSQATSFSGNLLDFFTYLRSNQGYSFTQYLQSVQAGTEPFTGSNAKLTTSSYRAAVA